MCDVTDCGRVLAGVMFDMYWRRRWIYLVTSGIAIGEVGSTICPGKVNVVPNTSSAGVQTKSSFTVVRMPSRTMGKNSYQLFGSPCAFKDALSWRWNLSMIPFAAGWYAVVRVRVLPRREVNSWKRWDSNCRPLSVEIVDGVPYRDIQLWTKALATVSAVISWIGMASTHLLKRSIQVRR